MGNQATFKKHVQNAERTGVFTLSKQNVNCFPRAIVQLSKTIRSLDLSFNKLKKIPNDVIGEFTNLRHLILNNNQIRELPDEIGQLTKLESLTLNDNQLIALPSTIINLTCLKKVELSNNQLTEFPLVFSNAKNLDTINLSKNKIETVPDAVGCLNVTELNLNQNRLAKLSSKLAEWPRLKVLRVEENCLPIDGLPSELLSSSAVSLIAFDGNLFDTKSFQNLDGYEKYLDRYTATKKKLDRG